MSEPRAIPVHEPEVIKSKARVWGGDQDKVATSSLSSLVVEGVKLTSRYGKAAELEAMVAMVGAVSSSLRREVTEIFCDSKLGAAFTVELRAWVLPNATEIARQMAAAADASYGGYSYVSVRHGDNEMEL